MNTLSIFCHLETFFEACYTVFGFLLYLTRMKNTATESRLGTFYLLSCSKTFMKEIPSDAALRNYNSSKDKRNYNRPYTS